MNERTKTAIVTGGARGIGKAEVERLAGMGYNVAFCHIDPKVEDRAQQLVESVKARGVDCFEELCDVTDPEAVESFVAKVANRFGDQIDVLVNNAGIAPQTSIANANLDDIKRCIEVNLIGSIIMSAAVVKHMIPYETGCIINTGSTATFNGEGGLLAYGSAKTGLAGLTRQMQFELAPKRIRVNTLCPGPTLTDMSRKAEELYPEAIAQAKAEVPAGRFAEPEEQADLMAFIVGNEFVYGQAISCNGGEAMYS